MRGGRVAARKDPVWRGCRRVPLIRPSGTVSPVGEKRGMVLFHPTITQQAGTKRGRSFPLPRGEGGRRPGEGDIPVREG